MKRITFYLSFLLFAFQVAGQTAVQLDPDKNNTSFSDSKLITISNQTIDDFSLAIMGSSVPWGQGADPGKGYAQLFAQWLAENAVNTWKSVNISVPGNNTTDVMNRWDSDLLPTYSRYVYYGLSLGNEGIHEKGQPAFDSYRDNMQILIKKARDHGKIPLLGNNYPRGDFNAADYNYVKQLNLLIHQWDVPSINLLGSIDNGNGRWVAAYQYDNAHPNTSGHAEMYYAIVPSLMDALAAGKPQPSRVDNTFVTLEKNNLLKRIKCVPENITHSFTLSFSFRTAFSGTIASLINGNQSTAQLRIGADGKLVYETQSMMSKLISPSALNDGQWHQVSLTHYYARGRTFLYIDGIQVTNSTIVEKLIPVRFYLNDFQETLQSVDFREMFFYRSGMTPEEIAALHSGKMLKSSLEIYAPLNGTASTNKEILRNDAQSLNTLSFDEKIITYVNGLEKKYFDDEDIKKITLYSVTGQKMQNLPGKNINLLEELIPAFI
ncbi:MAG: GDSL-type esterase/lipase family protein [Paludibacteraceae bacterium]